MFRIIVGVAALMAAALVACGDSAPEVNLEATVEAQVAARLDTQAASQAVAPTPLPSAIVSTTPLPDGQAPPPLPMATPTITPTPFVGAWTNQFTPIDPITDREVASIALDSKQPREGYLVGIRCTFNSSVEQENGLEAYIDWRIELGSEGYRPTVAVRIDGGDVDEGVWELGELGRSTSTERYVTFAPDADAFISSMKGGSRLVARVWLQGGTTITAQWEIAGFRDAVRPIENKCDPNFVPTPTPTSTPTPTPTPTPTNTPTPTPTPAPTNTPIPTPTPAPTNTPIPTPTPTPITIRDYLWRYDRGDGVSSSSSAVVDGVVYFVSDGLYAVDAASGDLRWQYETEEEVRSLSVMDGGVYFVGDGIGLYAVDAASGDLRWEYRTDRVSVTSTDGVEIILTTDGVRISSLGVVDGVVYFVADDDSSSRWGGLYAVDAASGDLLWIYGTREFADVRLSSLVVVDGVVYFGGYYGGGGEYSVYAVDAASGDLRWEYETKEEVRSLSVVDGVVYAGTDPYVGAGYLYAVDAVSGDLQWRYGISSPVVVDGVVFGSGSDAVYAVDAASGELRWEYRPEGRVVSSSYHPLGVVDGVVYVVVVADDEDYYDYGYDAYLQAVDAASGELRWEYRPECGGSICYLDAADGADGVVYVVVVFDVYDYDAYLQAVDAASGELRWRYSPVGSQEISFLGVVDGVVYFESYNYTFDDGYGRYYLYAVEGR